MINRIGLVIFMLLFATNIFAGKEYEDGKAFGEQLHSKGYDQSGKDAETMKQQMMKQPGMENFEQQNSRKL